MELTIILKIVSEVMNVPNEVIKSKLRNQEILFSRYIFYYLAREHGYILSKIGSFVNRDHSTVLKAVNVTIPQLIKQNYNLFNYFLSKAETKLNENIKFNEKGGEVTAIKLTEMCKNKYDKMLDFMNY